MKRTTLTLSDDVVGALEREARRRGVSVSQVAREALAAQLLKIKDGKRIIPFASLGRSGYKNTARDLDKLIAVEWNIDRDR